MENKEKNLDSLTQELSRPKDPAKRKTLKKLFGILIGTAGVTTAAALLSSCAAIDVKDKINVNFSNITPSIRRKYPKVYEHFGRQDFYGHLRRSDRVGIPGIDYYASNTKPYTEIASAAKGVMYMWKKSPIGGLTVYILHGLGYITSYAHMRNLFVGTGENFPRGAINLPRGAIIGSGGGTGFGGAIYPHTHFNVFGPIFTPYLRNIVFHKMQNERYPWQFPTDGEQFAIDNSGQLPFIHKGDFAFDDVLWQKHLEASKYLDTVLKEINTEEARSVLKRSDLELRLGVEHEVDKRVLYLYELILKGKSPFSLNDNEKIRAKLVGYMSTMPLLTAPIKNTETPELYKIIRSTPIERWE